MFQEATSDPQRVQVAAQIITTFIKVGSPSELNISGELRESLMNDFFKICTSQELCSPNMFDKARDAILLQLHSELYPRFLRSEYYKQYVSGVKKLSDEDKEIEKYRKSILYEDVDTSVSNICEDDFSRVLSMCAHNENVWKCVKDKPNVQVFQSRKAFTVRNKTGLKIFKIKYEFNYSASTLPIFPKKNVNF